LPRFDDFRHGHAEPVLDEDDLAARDKAVVDIDVDRLADLAVELDDGTAAELEELADLHGGAPEDGGDLHRDVVDGLEILGGTVGARFAEGALAVELGKEGVRVNAIGPGFIATPLNAGTRANNPDAVKMFIDHTPLGRAGTPEDIVGPALFLASDLSSYVTGSIVMADGGYRAI